MAKPGTEYTKQRAEWFGIPLQAEGETDADFRFRVSNALRAQGHMIEAHEALQNALFDDPEQGDNVMAGIMGAVAMETQGVNYGHPDRRTEDEQVAGLYLKNKKPDPSPAAIMLMMEMMRRS